MSSGAYAAAAALKAAAQAAYRSTFEAGSQFSRANIAVRQATDLVEVLARSIDLLVAAEALHAEGEAAVKALRATLAETMNDVGATKIEATHHAAHLSRRPAFVSIDQEELIPAEFSTTKVVLDKRAIASAIRDGIAVPGASLLTPNEPVLVLRARSMETAQ
jgi:hypothetical protein